MTALLFSGMLFPYMIEIQRWTLLNPPTPYTCNLFTLFRTQPFLLVSLETWPLCLRRSNELHIGLDSRPHPSTCNLFTLFQNPTHCDCTCYCTFT
jgi:hypothetical protein